TSVFSPDDTPLNSLLPFFARNKTQKSPDDHRLPMPVFLPVTMTEQTEHLLSVSLGWTWAIPGSRSSLPALLPVVWVQTAPDTPHCLPQSQAFQRTWPPMRNGTPLQKYLL